MSERLPEFWPSKLAALLSGESECQFQVWLPAHRKIVKIPRNGDLAGWKVDHTVLLNESIDRLEAERWSVRREGQNYFRLKGQTAVLVGKPDIVATTGNVVCVADAKTGEPRDRDLVQVAIYMIAIPLVWHRPSLLMEGRVCYRGSTVVVTPETVARTEPRLFALLRELANPGKAPMPVPAERICRYCDIRKADCPARIDTPEPVEVTTEAF